MPRTRSLLETAAAVPTAAAAPAGSGELAVWGLPATSGGGCGLARRAAFGSASAWV